MVCFTSFCFSASLPFSAPDQWLKSRSDDNRWNHSFASYFTTFNDFLAFGWGAIVVTDKKTGRGHVAIRSAGPDGSHPAGNGSSGQGALGGTVQQFARMIKVRFGESLPKLPNQVGFSRHWTLPSTYNRNLTSLHPLLAFRSCLSIHSNLNPA
jgi:hypothetical protein